MNNAFKKHLCLTLVLGLSAGCSGSLSSQVGSPSLGGRPGTISPGQVLSMGEDMYKAATLSDEDVIKMADEAIAEMDGLNPVADPSDPYAQRLERLVANIKTEEDLTLDYKVYLVSDVNAFSMANGSVRVFAGLMDIMSDDEIRFILGHEIGHVKHGHRKARMKRAYAASAAAKAANTGVRAATSSNVGGVAAVVGSNLAMGLISDVIKGQFSQGDETESDEFGLHLLTKYENNKEAAVTALLKLGGEAGVDGSGDFLTDITSSHPDPRSRAEHIQSLIPEMEGKELPAVSFEKPKAQAVAKLNADGGGKASAASGAPSQSGDTQVAEAGEPSHVAQNGWYVQVGAFSQRANADRLKANLAGQSLPAHVIPASSQGAPIYRLVVGPYKDKRSAIEAKQGASELPGAFVRRIYF